MKLKNIGRAMLALAASAGSILGMTSCSRSYTVGYFFVTGAQTAAGTQFGQIASFRIQNNDGQLRPTSNPISSAGGNPIQVIVNSSGTYLYVLNNGCGTGTGQTACAGGATQVTKSQIDQFAIGGSGVLTHQQTFFPQGTNTVSMQLSGNFLYTLDEFAPGNGSGVPQTKGDISAFSVDPNTGRLSPLLNTQAKDPITGLPLTYFPVGTNPTWLALGGGYAFIAEQGPGSGAAVSADDPQQAVFIYNQSATTGQLTLTQSTPTPTGSTQLTYVYASGSVLYVLDAGATGSVGRIVPYNIQANGVLGPIAGGPRANDSQGSQPVFPSRIIKENGTHPFLWVANSGVNVQQGAPASLITAYLILTNQTLGDANQGGGNAITVGTGARCIVEDPSNQYLYTANFNDSTITGKKINFQTAGLDVLPKPMPTPPGSPTWCTVTGSTF